jgi:hypothetical protein
MQPSATSNMAIIGTQQQRRHLLVHRDPANAATKHLTQDAHSKIVRMTGSTKIMQQYGVGSEFIHMELNSGQ